MGKSIYTKGNYAFNLKIALFACFLLVTFACSGFGQKKAEQKPPSPEKNQVTSKNKAAIDPDAVAAICNSSRNLLNADSYRARAVIVTPDKNEYTIKGEYVAPNRFHTFDFVMEPPQTEGSITVATEPYLKNSMADWKKLNVEPIADVILFQQLNMFSPVCVSLPENKTNKPETNTNKPENKASIQSVGTETLDGITMNVYRFDYEVRFLKNKSKRETKLWVGSGDNLPYKFELVDHVSDSQGKPSVGKVTIYYSDYGAKIKI